MTTHNNNTPLIPSTTSKGSSRTTFHQDDYAHPCHPLYVHPLYVLGASLVSVLFDRTSYGSLRRTIQVALLVRNKLDLIDGSSQKPNEGSPLSRQWQRCNDLVVSWLTNFLSKDLARSVEYSELARVIWVKLEDRYGKADAARVFELKKNLSHIAQGALDIAFYFNKIKPL
ncbi:hypothetical protein K7X08_010071 [Anisodus acutangulus]|uniref:Retrotransposon Copia-like N-terminal domain-containing protein n=1 Tax=Anisodus acutangulus TaxID=402998 RepID=A0A9Q1RRD9_9SOLA|nr:hypothetical protein K7X08_010071 [Anisodus acutangulus]